MNKQENIEKGYAGDSFSDFLKEEGTYEETTERAIKRVVAFQCAEKNYLRSAACLHFCPSGEEAG